jgi:glycosyltransferase involved in cell wall biosynthesis
VKFLFAHQNFPGQYRRLALHLAARGHQVAALGDKGNVRRRRAEVPGIRLLGYEPPRDVEGFDAAVARGQAAAGAAALLRREGFRPEVIFAHPGWGEASFLKDVFPEARLVLYCEFFYRARGSDVGFDPEFPVSAQSLLQLRVRNAPFLMALDAADHGIAPTRWQKEQFPAQYQALVNVIHDGIDTDAVCPAAERGAEEIVTYVARNLEPYRGFHSFMRAIPEIQRRRPRAKLVIVGGDAVSYSPRLPAGQTYRSRLVQELGGAIDWSRVEMRGQIPYADYLALLRASSAHVYLTYPFVLSWSMLEAMSAGVPVVGSRTAPVEEVIRDGDNGFLADFFSPRDIAQQVERALIDGQAVRARARQTIVERYDLKRVCLPQQAALAQALAGAQRRSTRAASCARIP